jgi:methylglyoxal synthase
MKDTKIINLISGPIGGAIGNLGHSVSAGKYALMIIEQPMRLS